MTGALAENMIFTSQIRKANTKSGMMQDVTIITPRRAEPTPAPAPAIPQPTPVEIELPEIHIGTVVKHRFFGKGTITEINEATNRLYVRFGDQVKPFQLTMAFAKGMLEIEE